MINLWTINGLSCTKNVLLRINTGQIVHLDDVYGAVPFDHQAGSPCIRYQLNGTTASRCINRSQVLELIDPLEIY